MCKHDMIWVMLLTTPQLNANMNVVLRMDNIYVIVPVSPVQFWF